MLLKDIINEFKAKDLSNIHYEYTEVDFDAARLKYIRDFSIGIIKCGEYFEDIKERYLDSQDDIFPLTLSNELSWLVGMILLSDKARLLTDLYELVTSSTNLILNARVSVDNNKPLYWKFNLNRKDVFIFSYYMGSAHYIHHMDFNNTDKDSPLYNMDDHVLSVTLGSFIYKNIKEGKL